MTDVSFLNAKPAGVHGPIVAKNGHFVEKNTGARMRFLGTNFAAKDAFPSHADAEKVAARIANLGINLVRLHHMDNSDWGQDASIWDYSVKDRQHFRQAALPKKCRPALRGPAQPRQAAPRHRSSSKRSRKPQPKGQRPKRRPTVTEVYQLSSKGGASRAAPVFCFCALGK